MPRQEYIKTNVKRRFHVTGELTGESALRSEWYMWLPTTSSANLNSARNTMTIPENMKIQTVMSEHTIGDD
jgi:hypothetical protein